MWGIFSCIALPSASPWALLPMGMKLQQDVFKLDPKETFLTARSREGRMERRMEASREVTFPESG